MLADKLRAAADFGVSVANGITWTNKPNFEVVNRGTNLFTAYGMAYGNGIFMAVGENGKCATSTDGVTWTLKKQFENQFGTQQAYGIAYSSSQGFLVVGANGRGSISNDKGETWTNAPIYNAIGFITVTAVAWSGSVWCVVATGNKCATAATATGTWTNQAGFTTAFNSGTGNPVAIAWNGSRFAVVGTCMATSTNGSTWTASSSFNGIWVTTNQARSITWASGGWVVVGPSGRCVTTTVNDASSGWTLRTSLASAVTAIMHAVYANGAVVYAVGGNGQGARSSDSGVNWVSQTSYNTAFGAGQTGYAIAYSGSLYCVVGFYGTAATSPGTAVSNQTTWTSRSGLKNSWAPYPDMKEVIWIPSLSTFFSVGSLGRSATCTDTTGDTWTSSAAFTTAIGSTSTANSVAYSPELSLYVVVGSLGKSVTSPNGTTWTNQTSFTTNFGAGNNAEKVVWNGTKFCAVGSAGKCVTSTNGTTWTSQASFTSAIGSGNTAYSIAWNGTTFCAVGGFGSICATSPDGVTWAAQAGIPSGYWYDITWNGSIFCAVGNSGPGSMCATSPDGVTWTNQSTAFSSAAGGSIDFNSVVWTGTNFVTVGKSGRCLTSFDGITWNSQSTSFTEATPGSVLNGQSYKVANSVTWSGSRLMAVTDVSLCATSL